VDRGVGGSAQQTLRQNQVRVVEVVCHEREVQAQNLNFHLMILAGLLQQQLQPFGLPASLYQHRPAVVDLD